MRKDTIRSPLIKELQKGLLAWYDFANSSNVLYIGAEGDALAEHLLSRSGIVYDENGRQKGNNLYVTVVKVEQSFTKEFIDKHPNFFDYIVCVEKIEKYENISEVLIKWKRMLKPDGILILGFNNRLGIRYFCGDRDLYTARSFDGVENYRRAYNKKEDSFYGRSYAKAELEELLDSIDLKNRRFYSVYSDLNNPSHLFLYGYTPREDVTNRIFPTYNYPDTVFLEEEALYTTLVRNGLFHVMANAYLVEVSVDSAKELSNAVQVTAAMGRSACDATVTVICDNNTVEKRNVYPQGRTKLAKMVNYVDDIAIHGLKVVPMELSEKGIRMQYIDAPSGQLYLKRLLQTDKKVFIEALDRFYELILASSDSLTEDRNDGMGVRLKYGYPDLIPQNSFYVNGDYLFFDQEFREEDYPVNAIMYRTILMLYYSSPESGKIIPIEDLYKRYHLDERIDDWKQFESRFTGIHRNERELLECRRNTRRNGDIVNSNRQRMNYSEGDYYRLFVDIFDNADTRKLILFGSGLYTRRFIELYGKDYPPYAIIDNNEKKYGKEIEGVKIVSPDMLYNLSSGEYKVIICIKNYVSVMKQLDDLRVTDYSIFDPNRNYPRKHHAIALTGKPNEKKKYHIGYISGIFDLFHVGHLNLIKRAKEFCDYLMVGIVTDKGTIRHKGVAPFVPFEERMEIVRSCRYVDEVVEIPLDANGPKEAYSMYHFDVMFQGTDHINEPYWIDAKEWLREHGADIVFFPYTLSTNSTQIKKLIESKLN